MTQSIPAPQRASRRRPQAVAFVDLIVVNQFNRRIESEARGMPSVRYQTDWYTSLWTLHDFPPIGGGFCHVVVWQHRGWHVTKPIVACTDGWAVEHHEITVVAPRVLFVVTDYDFEYRNRQWMTPLRSSTDLRAMGHSDKGTIGEARKYTHSNSPMVRKSDCPTVVLQQKSRPRKPESTNRTERG